MNLYEMFVNSTHQYGDRIALAADGQELTYTELYNKVRCMVEIVAPHITSDMPNIGFLSPNTLNFEIGVLGILGAGGIIVPFNPLYQPEELSTLIEHSGMRTMLYDPIMQPTIDGLGKIFGGRLEFLNVAECVSRPAPEFQDRALPSGDEVSMILYTSGTTGDPKGVMLSHDNVSSNVEAVMDAFPVDEKTTFQVVLPLFHTFAMTVNLFLAVRNGSKQRLYIQYDAKKLSEHLCTDEDSLLAAVPPMLALLARTVGPGYEKRYRARYIISGGGPLPLEVAHLFEKKIGQKVIEGYGLTETSPVLAMNRPHANRVGTIGPPMLGAEIEVRDDAGNEVPRGSVGELCARGPMIMKGYYKNPERTREVLSEDGWLRTGDLATQDEDGYLKIVGRCKDLIIDSGENIYPREIEEVLVRHESVWEAAVVGRPHKLRGEVPHAFITAHPDVESPPDLKVLRDYCREHLAAFKVPDDFTIIDAFPKTATNKIRKEILRQRFQKKDG